MRAINHALTGAVIGLTISEPIFAIALSVGSHYVLDVIPHFGVHKNDHLKDWFRYVLYVDAALCFGLVILLMIVKPKNWLLAIVCAFAAAAPDLLSINKFIKGRQGKPWKAGPYVRFASKIQWFERPNGIYVEAVWFVGMSWVLYTLLR